MNKTKTKIKYFVKKRVINQATRLNLKGTYPTSNSKPNQSKNSILFHPKKHGYLKIKNLNNSNTTSK